MQESYIYIKRLDDGSYVLPSVNETQSLVIYGVVYPIFLGVVFYKIIAKILRFN